ncbi:unnamed protein product [Polarella glacialis]|uniref:Uncharacterized protein n=1 Tax=Polarella glacialis TaxID=89957 RepID=A0A813H6X3_POLGL|nr:unnamed protein product [Polarella glacialis]
MNEEKLKDKFETGDKEKEEFEKKQKDIEGVVYPMLRKGSQAAGGVRLPRGGLSGGGGDATTCAGVAGSSAGEVANSVAREAEKVRGEDETNKGMIESRNGLEKCCFTVRNTMNEVKLEDKFETGDKEKDEFEKKQKEIEGVVYPMLGKGYQAAGGVGLPQGGLLGGGGDATSAGGAGSSAVEEANSVALEAEKVRGEDETNTGMIESHNGLEKCCFTVRVPRTRKSLGVSLRPLKGRPCRRRA